MSADERLPPAEAPQVEGAASEQETLLPGASADDETLPPPVDGDASTGSSPGPPTRTYGPQPGGTIGRFEVLEVLGRGAMGVVVAARDPNLDRKVAIKLLRAGAYGNDDRAKAALVHEAQTVAKLEHANVVTVYEAGLDDDQVFVAMQFVDGGTLRQWVRSTPRTWGEIVEVYREAGRGLAAAHAAGLVHRDFKPDNVLIATDGRVFVSDFGLAGRATTTGGMSTRPAQPRAPDPSGSDSAVSGGLQATETQHGVVVGTPAYMAPEVWEGGELDPLSDQFAYCVAMWEALYGGRPFTPEALAGIAAGLESSALPAEPDDTEVPRWLREIVARGLAPSGPQRWPDMRSLLDALDRGDPAALRRRRLAGAGLTTLVAAGAVAAALSVQGTEVADSASVDPCSAGDERAAQVWNEARTAKVNAAFEQTDVGYAADTTVRVVAGLDRYVEQWRGHYREACEATHVRHEQSESALDLRMRCLAIRLRTVESLVDELAAADEAVLNKAVPAVEALVAVRVCDDVNALEQHVPPPSDPEVATTVDELRDAMARATSLEQLGKYDAGGELMAEVVERATATDYPPVRAEALELHGRLLIRLGKAAEAETALREALTFAAESGDPRLESQIWDRLLFAVGYLQTRHEEAGHLIPAAALAVQRAKDEDARGRLALTTGMVLSTKGQNTDAQAKVEESIAILTALHGPNTFIAGVAQNTLGTILHNNGDLVGASAAYEAAAQAFAGSAGPDHPHNAAVRSNLAILLQNKGDFDGARENFGEAIRVWTAAHGEQHRNVATGYENLGGLEFVIGNLDEAAALYQKAFELRGKLLEPGDVLMASSHFNLATVDMQRGEYDQALAHARSALEIREGLLGAQHPDVDAVVELVGTIQRLGGLVPDAITTFRGLVASREQTLGGSHPVFARALHNLGDALINDGDCEEATTHLRRSLAINEAALGTAHPELAYALTGLGRCELEAGHAESAMSTLGRARTLREASPSMPEERGLTRWLFAQAAWAAGDQQAARASAEAAVADFAEAPAHGAHAETVAAWLAERG